MTSPWTYTTCTIGYHGPFPLCKKLGLLSVASASHHTNKHVGRRLPAQGTNHPLYWFSGMNERSCLVVERAGHFQKSVAMSHRRGRRQQSCLNSLSWKERNFSMGAFQMASDEQKKITGLPCSVPIPPQ